MNKKLLQYRERTHKRLYFKNVKFSLQREFLLRIANISKKFELNCSAGMKVGTIVVVHQFALLSQ